MMIGMKDSRSKSHVDMVGDYKYVSVVNESVLCLRLYIEFFHKVYKVDLK